jgi:glutathione S-transferase
MAKLEIIGAPQSNYVWAVRMACEEKGVPYELTGARPHTPDVQAIHPFGKIPVMRHGDFELCESKAIASYIDRMFEGPKVIPEDPQLAAQVEQWVSLANTTFDPTIMRNYVVKYVFAPEGKPDMTAIAAAAEQMKTQYAVLDSAVSKDGFLVGGQFTFADMNLLPMIYYAGRFDEAKALMAQSPNLSAYLARHSERPSFKAAAPPPRAG